MGLGTFTWFSVNKRLFAWNVMPICLLGGVIAIFIGIVLFPIENPELLTLAFNYISFLLAQFIFFSILFRRKYPNREVKLNVWRVIILFAFSTLGGLISGWIGFGIDTMFYFILTLIFKVNQAIAIVISISLMAAVYMAGFIALHAFLKC